MPGTGTGTLSGILLRHRFDDPVRLGMMRLGGLWVFERNPARFYARPKWLPMHRRKQKMVGMVGLMALLAAASAQERAQWFTIEGDARHPVADVIEVDIRSLSHDGDHRSMALRVSRATRRSSWEAVPYRSYTAVVVFNCAEKTARYKSLAFYMLPLWEGRVHKTSSYTADEVRPMRFMDSQPNPTARIVNAACRTPLDNEDSNSVRKP